MQHVAASDRISRHHGEHGLGEAPYLDLKIQDVQPADTLGIEVAVITPNSLVTTGAEGLGPGAGEQDDSDRGIVSRDLEGARQLEERRRSKGVAHLRPVDGELGDAACGLVADVLPLSRRDPVHRTSLLLAACAASPARRDRSAAAAAGPHSASVGFTPACRESRHGGCAPAMWLRWRCRVPRRAPRADR